MKKEIDSLIKYGTLDLVGLSKDANLISSKWLKRKANVEVDRQRAKLIAQRYSQQHGVDYDKMFAPATKYMSICTMLAIGNQHDLEIHQMDVNSAHLIGKLIEDIYMTQPEGFVDQQHPDLACKLRKSLWLETVCTLLVPKDG